MFGLADLVDEIDKGSSVRVVNSGIFVPLERILVMKHDGIFTILLRSLASSFAPVEQASFRNAILEGELPINAIFLERLLSITKVIRN